MGKLTFSKDEPALMLKYQTELSIDDRAALRQEVEEIWEKFQPDVENAGLASAIISAHEVPKGGSVVSYNRGYNFLFKKSEDGTWKLTNK